MFKTKFSSSDDGFDAGFNKTTVTKGEDGFSPIIEVEKTSDGHLVIVTDAEGTQSFKVKNGEKGEKGDKGEQGIQGEKGDKGDPFDDLSILANSLKGSVSDNPIALSDVSLLPHEINVKLQSKNHLAYPFSQWTVSGKSDEITFKDNGDGTITVVALKDSTEEASVVLQSGLNAHINYPKGTYRFSGCPSGGSWKTHFIKIGARSRKTGRYITLTDTADLGNGVIFDAPEGIDYFYCEIRFLKFTQGETFTFSPMLRMVEQMFGYPYPKEHVMDSTDVSYEINTDGSVVTTTNAESVNRWRLLLCDGSSKFTAPSGKYYFSGCPEGGSTDTYRISVEARRYDIPIIVEKDVGNGLIIDAPDGIDYLYVRIEIYNSLEGETLTFRPKLYRICEKHEDEFICGKRDYSGISVRREGKNLCPTQKNDVWKELYLYVNPRENYTYYTVSCKHTNRSPALVTLQIQRWSNSSNMWLSMTQQNVTDISRSFYLYKSYATEGSYCKVRVKWYGLESGGQIERGEVATEYEPYVEPIVVQANEDGTVDGVMGNYPTTVLICPDQNITIDAEYNRDITKALKMDINKAFTELQTELRNAIISLGGNV